MSSVSSRFNLSDVSGMGRAACTRSAFKTILNCQMFIVFIDLELSISVSAWKGVLLYSGSPSLVVHDADVW